MPGFSFETGLQRADNCKDHLRWYNRNGSTTHNPRKDGYQATGERDASAQDWRCEQIREVVLPTRSRIGTGELSHRGGDAEKGHSTQKDTVDQ